MTSSRLPNVPHMLDMGPDFCFFFPFSWVHSRGIFYVNTFSCFLLVPYSPIFCILYISSNVLCYVLFQILLYILLSPPPKQFYILSRPVYTTLYLLYVLYLLFSIFSISNHRSFLFIIRLFVREETTAASANRLRLSFRKKTPK